MLIANRQELPTNSPLAPHLLLDVGDSKGIDYDFFEEAVSRFSEDDTIEAAFIGAIEELSKQLAKMTMNDDFKPYVAVCPFLTTINAKTDRDPGTKKHSPESSHGAGYRPFRTFPTA